MDSLRAAADDLRTKVSSLIDELRSDPRFIEIGKSMAALHSLEDYLDMPHTEFAGIPAIGGQNGQHSERLGNVQFKPDEFYGLEPLDAAKRVLKRIGKSSRISEIVAGIRAGSGDPGNEDKLRLSLARSTMEVAKVGDDLFGLVEFYPHLKRGTAGRRKKNGKDSDAATESTDAVAGETETPDDADTSSGETKGDS